MIPLWVTIVYIMRHWCYSKLSHKSASYEARWLIIPSRLVMGSLTLLMLEWRYLDDLWTYFKLCTCNGFSCGYSQHGCVSQTHVPTFNWAVLRDSVQRQQCYVCTLQNSKLMAFSYYRVIVMMSLLAQRHLVPRHKQTGNMASQSLWPSMHTSTSVLQIL